jgi:CRISPR-associated endoribonuclease Cas6
MPFLALIIRLSSSTDINICYEDFEYAHEAIFHLLSRTNVELARKVHDQRVGKCITISLFSDRRNRPILRLTFIGSEGMQVAMILINSMPTGSILKIGSKSFIVSKIELNHSPWVGVSTWSDFLETKQGKKMYFQFQTPTAIKKKDENDKRYVGLFPDAMDIFNGLERRWYSFQGPHLPMNLKDHMRSGDCVISYYQTQTVEFRTTERTQLGFIGKVVYSIQNSDRDLIKTLNALCVFSFYSLVGYQPSRGLGTVFTKIIK